MLGIISLQHRRVKTGNAYHGEQDHSAVQIPFYNWCKQKPSRCRSCQQNDPSRDLTLTHGNGLPGVVDEGIRSQYPGLAVCRCL